MTYPGPRGRETVRPMIPEIGWLRASAERARVWADADGDRLLVPLEDATRAVRDARAAVRQRTIAEIVKELRAEFQRFSEDSMATDEDLARRDGWLDAADLIESRFGGGES